jgi:hypothetical protein
MYKDFCSFLGSPAVPAEKEESVTSIIASDKEEAAEEQATKKIKGPKRPKGSGPERGRLAG